MLPLAPLIGLGILAVYAYGCTGDGHITPEHKDTSSSASGNSTNPTDTPSRFDVIGSSIYETQTDVPPPKDLFRDLGLYDQYMRDQVLDAGITDLARADTLPDALADAQRIDSQPPDQIIYPDRMLDTTQELDSYPDNAQDIINDTAAEDAFGCGPFNWCGDLPEIDITLDTYSNCGGKVYNFEVEEIEDQRRLHVSWRYLHGDPSHHDFYLFLDSGAFTVDDCYVCGGPRPGDASSCCSPDQYSCPTDEGYWEQIDGMKAILEEAYNAPWGDGTCASEEQKAQIDQILTCLGNIIPNTQDAGIQDAGIDDPIEFHWDGQN